MSMKDSLACLGLILGSGWTRIRSIEALGSSSDPKAFTRLLKAYSSKFFHTISAKRKHGVAMENTGEREALVCAISRQLALAPSRIYDALVTEEISVDELAEIAITTGSPQQMVLALLPYLDSPLFSQRVVDVVNMLSCQGVINLVELLGYTHIKHVGELMLRLAETRQLPASTKTEFAKKLLFQREVDLAANQLSRLARLDQFPAEIEPLLWEMSAQRDTRKFAMHIIRILDLQPRCERDRLFCLIANEDWEAVAEMSFYILVPAIVDELASDQIPLSEARHLIRILAEHGGASAAQCLLRQPKSRRSEAIEALVTMHERGTIPENEQKELMSILQEELSNLLDSIDGKHASAIVDRIWSTIKLLNYNLGSENIDRIMRQLHGRDTVCFALRILEKVLVNNSESIAFDHLLKASRISNLFTDELRTDMDDPFLAKSWFSVPVSSNKLNHLADRELKRRSNLC